MGVRGDTVVDLFAEVLGPRCGSQERLLEDPRNEYVTGILRPDPHAARPQGGPDPDDEAPELADDGEAGDYDDDDDDGTFVGHVPTSPSIDPTQLPRSIGLSFVLAGDTPSFRLCCTWARYLPDDDGAWVRHPALLVTGWLDALVTVQRLTRPDVEIQVETSATPGGRRVSIYLINAIQQAEPNRPDTREHIFQPQIRISVGAGTELRPLEGRGAAPQQDDEVGEERQLELLYSRRRAFARGHMCGATWRSIDPERHAGPLEEFRPDAPPFRFADRGLLDPVDLGAFSPPDVRTDFLPLYSVEAPETAWNSPDVASPVLAASVLAETWRPDAVETALRPLALAYRNWHRARLEEVPGLPERLRSVARANLGSCLEFAERLDDAINLLKDDATVRLAFCFANRAMALQGRWTRGSELQWRPFQLAFLLVTLRSTAYASDHARLLCDLLWFPTGGGKTEAYLALAAFALAHRRLRGDSGGGTGVLSRYTLRLLTIQQFRRALSTITACEFLRVDGLGQPGARVGWRPAECPREETFLWGGMRFSVGLWVGGNVTPNRMDSMRARVDNANHIFLGAIDILRGARPNYRGPNPAVLQLVRGQTVHVGGEPAQVTNCPCCRARLALPEGSGSGGGLPAGDHVVYVPHCDPGDPVDVAALAPLGAGIDVVSVSTAPLGDAHSTAVTLRIQPGQSLGSHRFDEWWAETLAPALGPGDLICARPARPGYALVRRDGPNSPVFGFEVLCPNPACELNRHAWAETVPVLRSARRIVSMTDRSYCSPTHANLPSLSGHWQDPPLETNRISARVSGRVPIPACMVDDQVYSHPPSLLVATADKFARLAFEPRAAGIFGNVSRFHARYGYYRPGAWPSGLDQVYRPDPPAGPGGWNPLHAHVPRFDPPDLVIQDELHLIEGPLGSMVGLYETAVELLAGASAAAGTPGPKYVASTATIRQAGPQIRALFGRDVAQFPPQGLDIDDSFFAVSGEPHPLDETAAGRLYVAVAAPGKGAQTPIVRVWSNLLQSAVRSAEAPASQDPDRLWTLAAYFNAVRELAGAATLYRQDIPERLRHRFGAAARPTEPNGYMELSSRADSVRLPAMLAALEIPGRIDVVCATSMFGTGVDINRLGLMIIHGQPKTTSTYIQATGRVGRLSGALVVTFLRAARPRDLDHYEFFCGYHRALYRHVEPITVSPFAPKARERCLGPLAVALLRQARELEGAAVSEDWLVEQRLAGQQFHSEARRMGTHRRDPEVEVIPHLIERRSQDQPRDIRPAAGITLVETEAVLDRWQQLGRISVSRDDLAYYEPAMTRAPIRSVVLGDPQHEGANLSQAFENAPQSLRAIEETTTFKT